MNPSCGTLRFLCSLIVLQLAAVACVPQREEPPVQAPTTSEGKHEVELAAPMGEMQRQAAKLGYSIQAKNGPLATFYFEELQEVLEELREIESYEGMPIAKSVRTILDPTLVPLDRALEAEDWEGAVASYSQLIDSCNRCHAATEHQFVVILPASGEPPFSQDFSRRSE